MSFCRYRLGVSGLGKAGSFPAFFVQFLKKCLTVTRNGASISLNITRQTRIRNMEITVVFKSGLKYNESLSLIDPGTGQNIVADVIGNAGDWGLFNLNSETGRYECCQTTFSFWSDFCKARQRLENLLNEVREEHGLELVEEFAEKHMDANDFTVEAQRAAFAKLSELSGRLS